MWEKRWDMEFNLSKCQGIRVTTAMDTINTVYILHGQVLEVVASAKYLGLISPVVYRGSHGKSKFTILYQEALKLNNILPEFCANIYLLSSTKLV